MKALKQDFTKHRTFRMFNNLFKNMIKHIIAIQKMDNHVINLQALIATCQQDICVQQTKIKI